MGLAEIFISLVKERYWFAWSPSISTKLPLIPNPSRTRCLSLIPDIAKWEWRDNGLTVSAVLKAFTSNPTTNVSRTLWQCTTLTPRTFSQTLLLYDFKVRKSGGLQPTDKNMYPHYPRSMELIYGFVSLRWVKQKLMASLSLCASLCSARWNPRPWTLWTCPAASEPGATATCEPSRLATPKMTTAFPPWPPPSPPPSGPPQVTMVKHKSAQYISGHVTLIRFILTRMCGYGYIKTISADSYCQTVSEYLHESFLYVFIFTEAFVVTSCELFVLWIQCFICSSTGCIKE